MTSTMPSESASWLAATIGAVSDALSRRHFWIGIGVGVLIAASVYVVAGCRRYRAKSMTVSLPFGLGSVTYETSSDDRVIAWRMYVQLTTRKAALPFDEEHDVIADIYTSLYELFPVTRELLSSMKLDDIARSNGVADVILRTLNDGLRPHLTRWNASFRRWWEIQVTDEAKKDHTPQQLQQLYPYYKELVEDLKRTNTELSRFADELRAISRADRPKLTKLRPTPAPPGVLAKGDERSATSTRLGICGVEPPTTLYDAAGSMSQKNSSRGKGA